MVFSRLNPPFLFGNKNTATFCKIAVYRFRILVWFYFWYDLSIPTLQQMTSALGCCVKDDADICVQSHVHETANIRFFYIVAYFCGQYLGGSCKVLIVFASSHRNGIFTYFADIIFCCGLITNLSDKFRCFGCLGNDDRYGIFIDDFELLAYRNSPSGSSIDSAR